MKKMIAAGVVLLSFLACQNDELNEAPGGNESKEAAYMSLSIAMPDGTGTRTIDEGEEKDEGTKEEQTISKLWVLVYYDQDASNKDVLEKKVECDGSDLLPTGPNNSAVTNKTTVYTVPAFSVSKGPKKVVVIVNPNDKFNTPTTKTVNIEITGPTLASMRTAMKLTKDDVEKISSPYSTTDGQRAFGFMMTNANTKVNQTQDYTESSTSGQANEAVDTQMENGAFYDDGSVYVDVQGTKTNPTTVVIPVERVVAKITDITGQNKKDSDNPYTFEVKNETGHTVTFESVALVNGNTRFYPIKIIRASSGSEGTNDYVVDPNFDGTINNTDFYFRKFNFSTEAEADEDNSSDKDADITASDFQKLIDSENNDKRPVFYTLENTMKADKQKTAYTTGLCYKAVYRLNSTDSGTQTNDGEGSEKTDPNVYKFGGKLYSWDDLSENAADLGISLGNDISDNSDVATFKAKGIDKYEGGVCYYSYWIKHVNSDTKLDVMKFAVVRNNVYQMEINSVSGIGSVTPEDPNENVDDETDDAVLQILVKVLPWTVRKNTIDF